MNELTLNEIKSNKDYRFKQYYTNEEIRNYENVEKMKSENCIVFMEFNKSLSLEIHLIEYDGKYQFDYNIFVKEDEDDWNNIDGFKCEDYNEISEDIMINILLEYLKEHNKDLYKLHFVLNSL